MEPKNGPVQMRPTSLLPLILLLNAGGVAAPARADSTTATCILSRHDHTIPPEKGPCTFSQRQGNVNVRFGPWAFDFPSEQEGPRLRQRSPSRRAGIATTFSWDAGRGRARRAVP